MGRFFFRCHTGKNDSHIRVLGNVANGESCVLNSAPGQGLHAQKPDILFTAGFDQFRALRLYNVVGEHQSLYPGIFQSFPEHIRGVKGQADVADDALFFCLLQVFQSSAGGLDDGKVLRSGVMELVEVDVVSAKIL